MDNEMYFIALITEAFKQDNRETALAAALEKIKTLDLYSVMKIMGHIVPLFLSIILN